MPPELTQAEQRQMVGALTDPACYPHPVTAVAVIETHISFVLLTGLFAYKIKKAVNLGFVDYTTLALRRFFCSEDLRLNGRLAPGLYLETVAICGSPDEPRLGGDGEAVDYAVRMREFPQEQLLDRVLAGGGFTPAQVDALAVRVADFHRDARPAPADSPWGNPDAVWAPVAASFAHIRTLGGDTPLLSDLESWCLGEFRRLESVIAGRKAAGWVRECHGDLHLGNMVLWEGEATLFDCIEFNPALRWIDIVSDLAFLVMDLSERGRPDYAWRLVNDWLERLGDFDGLGLLRFYQVYRTLVRAKVATIQGADATLGATERQEAREGAAAYLDYAARVITPGRPALLVTHGYSGSGKSTVARAVAESLGAVHLRSDVERKRLHGLPALARSGSAPATGLYDEGATAATYTRLADLAATAITAGYPAVVDAACLAGWQRQMFIRLAREWAAPCLILDCRAPPEVLDRRVGARWRAGDDASEATAAVLARQLREAETLAGEELALAIPVDTVADLAPQLTAIRERLGIRP